MILISFARLPRYPHILIEVFTSPFAYQSYLSYNDSVSDRRTGSQRVNCVLCIFVYNHPSGDPEASEDDVRLTKRLAEAGGIMGIDILDHIIIGGKKYLSLKREGLF